MESPSDEVLGRLGDRCEDAIVAYRKAIGLLIEMARKVERDHFASTGTPREYMTVEPCSPNAEVIFREDGKVQVKLFNPEDDLVLEMEVTL